jgi:hypothetical protein
MSALIKAVSCIGLLACLAMPVAAADTMMPVNDTFNEFGLKWNGGQITSYEGLWNATLDQNGFVIICGVGRMKDSNSAQATLQWLHSVTIVLNDVKILKDVSFFTKVPSSAKLTTSIATCRTTKAKAPAGKVDLYMTWPPATARF